LLPLGLLSITTLHNFSSNEALVQGAGVR